eukprot:352394-Chlamydomonas_euryale.AAC.3
MCGRQTLCAPVRAIHMPPLAARLEVCTWKSPEPCMHAHRCAQGAQLNGCSWQSPEPQHACACMQSCTVRAYVGSQACCAYEYAARRVQYVLYSQVKRCGCRRWCCGSPKTAFASHGVDFTQWIGRLRKKCVPRRANALVLVFSGMNLMCTHAKKASKGRHKDNIPCRWREDEEDQQVEEEEGEQLPDQEKQPVLEKGAAEPAETAIDSDTNHEDF